MVCTNCGAENKEGTKFCSACGKMIGEPAENSGDNNVIPPQETGNFGGSGTAAAGASMAGAPQPTKKKKSALPIILAGACAAIVALVAIVVIVLLNAKPTIDLDDYLKIEFSGYNGYGIATVTIEWDDLEYDYKDKLSLTKQAKKEDDDRYPIEILQDSISVSLNKDTALSNGDTVEYTWNVAEDLTTYVKCKVKYEDDYQNVKKLTEIETFDPFSDLDVIFSGVSTYGTVRWYYQNYQLSSYDFSCDKTAELSNGDTVTISLINTDIEYYADYYGMIPESLEKVYEVSGLTEVESVDVFANLEVTFSGISPNGRVNLNYNGVPQVSTGYFSVDKSNGLRNGDAVTISITLDMESFATYYGMIPERLEKEYEVSGLNEYVESYGELSDAFVDGLKSEAEDTIYSYTAGYYDSTTSLTDLAYAGYIFNMIKDGSNRNPVNELYIIYSGTVSSSNGNFSASKVYYPVRFTNIISNEGDLSYTSNDGIMGSARLDGTYYSTKGYVIPFTCYIDLVEAKRDTYTSECGDGFEDYAEYDLITGLNDISDEQKEIFYADARDRVESYIAQNNDYNASDLDVLGEYILLAKTQGTDFANNNKFYVILSATVSSPRNRFTATTVYFPVEYDGVVKLSGDEYIVTTTRGLTDNYSNLPNSYYSIRGYVDGEEMYSKLITANRNNYTYEVSEGLKQFGE